MKSLCKLPKLLLPVRSKEAGLLSVEKGKNLMDVCRWREKNYPVLTFGSVEGESILILMGSRDSTEGYDSGMFQGGTE